MEQVQTDVCIIGTGAGAQTIAASLALLGAPVVLVGEDSATNDGFQPITLAHHALITAARAADDIRKAHAFGLAGLTPMLDGEAVQARVRSLLEDLAPRTSAERLAALGVRIIRGAPVFADLRAVDVGNVRIRARRFVVATGSEPIIPDVPGLADTAFLTPDSLPLQPDLPRRIVILGGSPEGVELAQAYRDLGREVALIADGSILAEHDSEAVALVRDHLRRSGVQLLEHTRILRVQRLTSGVTFDVDGPNGHAMLNFGDVIVTSGRKPRIGLLALEKAGIAFSERGITVDTSLRSSNSRVFALGACADCPHGLDSLEHQAGNILRSLLFGQSAKYRVDCVPRCLRSVPEVASMGSSEEEAMARDNKAQIVRFPFSEIEQARFERQTAGFIKVMLDRKGRILGVVIAGKNAAELMTPWVLAKQNNLTIRAMADLVTPEMARSAAFRRVAIQALAPRLRSPWVQRFIRWVRALG